jgi:hypothetical protein
MILLLTKLAEMVHLGLKMAVDEFDQMVASRRWDRDAHPPPPAWFKYPPIS